VDSVTGAGGPLSFSHDGQFLRVYFEEAPPEGEEQEVTVHYHGQPVRDPDWGGFYFASNIVYNLGIGLTTVPPNFGKVWHPCFDSFVERATYTFRVKTAGGRRLHGQGELIEETALGGDTIIRAYRLDHPIPTHVSAIACAGYAEHAYTHSGAYGDYPVTLRAKPNQLNAMVSRMSDLPAAIDALEHWYGPYPYGRVGYVLTTDGALEIPTNIAYPDFMPSQSQASNRRLLTHELGHHWWGDKVTPRVHNHMWLKEGPAEYSAHLVEEWINGRAHMVGVVKDNLLRILSEAHIDDEGFRALSPMADEHIYGTHTYYKGAAVMHNLRGYLGDELFREAMRQAQQRLADTVITPEMWRDTMEAITGRDLHPFFDDWVFKPGYSVFEVRRFSAEPMGGTWAVQVRIGQKLYGTAEPHGPTPLSLTLVGDQGQVHEAMVTASGPLTEARPKAAPITPMYLPRSRAGTRSAMIAC
ncbi:MAG: M1 family aminopeptidase, partial [Flavobacteriales bacterium]